MPRRAAPDGPVLKWAGGKAQLLPELLRRLPETIETYYEPFLGGGAVFFALAAEGRFRRAVLSDANVDLMTVYRALQSEVDSVIAALRGLRYDRDVYYELRAARPTRLAERAARVIYLNKTCYNGLYRVNRQGAFNVPFGRYRNPTICDEPVLRSAAAALQRAELREGDFEPLCDEASPGDAVYLDPPYMPVSATANFTDYHHTAFGDAEHARLAAAFGRLAKRKVAALLSNSDTPATRALYERFDVSTVLVRRAINRDAEGRAPIAELLVSARRAPRVKAR